MAAGVGIAHGVVVGVGAAVLRDGRFQIAQVGVAGGEGAELGVVVPCAQVLQAGLLYCSLLQAKTRLCPGSPCNKLTGITCYLYFTILLTG